MNCSELLHSSEPRFLERVGASEAEFAAFSERWQREGFPAWLAARRVAGLRPQAEAQAAASARLEARLAAEAEAPYQPQYTRRPKRGPSSRFLGVSWHVPLAKWRTQVRRGVCSRSALEYWRTDAAYPLLHRSSLMCSWLGCRTEALTLCAALRRRRG